MSYRAHFSEDCSIVALNDDESWRLLATERLGRLIVGVGREVDVFPVNFVLDSDHLYFRTAEGKKLVELSVNSSVVFEADHVDFASGYGWSVVVRGSASVLTSFNEMAAVDELGLHPWIAKAKYNVVAIKPSRITGRYKLIETHTDF